METRCEPGKLTFALIAFLFSVGVVILLLLINFANQNSMLYTTELSSAKVQNLELDQALRAVVVDLSYTHAHVEHPDTAPIVRECLKKNGEYLILEVDPWNRYIRVCLIDPTTIGFQIVDIVGRIAKERTAYIKDSIKNINELFDFAAKNGYRILRRHPF